MPSRNGQFLLFDPLAFLSPFFGNLLRRGCVGMMHPARGIGADLNQFSSPSTVHDQCFGHLLTWLLLRGNLGTCAVGLGLLDFKLHVTVLSQRSAFASASSGGNLHKLWF